MPNFDYAIAVGICTLAMLIGLRVVIPLMRSATRRRTDEMLLRIDESDAADTEDNMASSLVVTKDENEANNSEADG